MLTVKQLLSQSQSHKPILVSNSAMVSIAFSKTMIGKDPRGYYKSIKGSARTRESGKKTKLFEIRLYYPKKFVPIEFREEGKPYAGPDQAPPFTIATNVWVSCSCEYFLYNCEVADEEQDASSVKYSNGAGYVQQYTYKTKSGTLVTRRGPNPNHIPHLCKHLIGALKKGALVKK